MEPNETSNVTPEQKTEDSTTAPQTIEPMQTTQPHKGSLIGNILTDALLVIACVMIIGSLLIVSVVLASIFGPHSSCDKWGCSPSREALLVYALGSFLISIPASVKLIKSGWRQVP